MAGTMAAAAAAAAPAAAAGSKKEKRARAAVARIRGMAGGSGSPKLSSAEAARYLGVSQRTLTTLCGNHEIGFYLIANRRVFKKETLDEYLAANWVPAVEKDAGYGDRGENPWVE